MNQITESARVSLLANEDGYDPIEDRLRASVRTTIEAMFEEELADFLGRLRYGRGEGQAKATGMGTASGSSPAPSAPKPCECHAPGSKTPRAR